MEIMAGLSLSPIHRLSKSWDVCIYSYASF